MTRTLSALAAAAWLATAAVAAVAADAPRLVVQSRPYRGFGGAELVFKGKAVLCWSAGEAELYDRDTGRLLRSFAVGRLRVANNGATVVGAINPLLNRRTNSLRLYAFDAGSDADPRHILGDFVCNLFDLSPDGKRVATFQTPAQVGRDKGSITLWNPTSGKQLAAWDVPDLAALNFGIMTVVPLGLDDKKNPKWGVACAHADGTIRVWDAQTTKVATEIAVKTTAPLRKMDVTADGQWIAGATADEVVVWRVADKAVVGRVPVKGAKMIGLAEGGKSIWVRADDITVWSVADAKELNRAADPAAMPLGWGRAANTVRVVGFASAFPSVYDLPGGKPDDPPTAALAPWTDEVTAAGTAVAAVTGGHGEPRVRVRLWNLETGIQATSLRLTPPAGPSKPVVTADKGYVLAGTPGGAKADGGPVVSVGPVPGRAAPKAATLRVPGLHAVVVARTAGVVAVADEAGVRVWDPAANKDVCQLQDAPGKPTFLRITDDGTRVVVGTGKDKPLAAWDGKTGRRVAVLADGTAAFEYTPGFTQLGGTRLVAASRDPAKKDDSTAFVVRTWDLTDGKLLAAVPTAVAPHTLAVEPGGKWYTTAASGEAIRVHAAATGAELWTASAGAGGEPVSVAFDDRGVLVGDADGTVRAFDGKAGKGTVGGKLRFAVKVGGRPTSLGVVAAGKTPRRLVAACLGTDGFVLLDAADGKEVVRLHAFNDDAWVAVDPQGRYDAGGAGGRSAEVSKLLHWVVGNDIVEFDQLKDRFYEPGLLAKLFGYSDEPLRPVGAGLAGVKPHPEVAVAAAGKKDAKLTATVTNRGGGIGRVVVMVNGKERSADARGPKPDENAKEATLSIDLKGDPRLVPGKNRVEVIAYNADGSVASRGAVREFDEPPAKAAEPTFRAVVCGVSAYKNASLDLRYAAKDADDFAAAVALAAANLFGKDRTRVAALTSSGDAKSKPTRANVLAALDALVRESKPEDVVVVYLAGHGVSADGDFFYLTADSTTGELKDAAAKATAVSSKDLTDRLKEVPARKQVLVFDTCASGQFVKLLASARGVPGSQVRAMESLKDRTGTFVLAGCAADAVSYESNRFGQGVLTYSLLQGMRGGALKDGDVVDVGRLFDFAAEKVPEFARDLGGVQQPVVAIPKGGQSIPLGRLPKADWARIPLQPTRPAFVRSTFREYGKLKDALGVGAKLDDALKSAAGRGKGAALVFIDATDLPDAYAVAGDYVADGDKVAVAGSLLLGDKVLGPLQAVGTKDKLDELAAKLAAGAEALLKSAKP